MKLPNIQVLMPKELKEHLKYHNITRFDYYVTDAQIFYCRSKNKEITENYFLKILPTSSSADSKLLDEKNKQEWLRKNTLLPIPKILYYNKNKDHEFLLTTELKGTAAYKLPKLDRKEATIILARTLKRIHEIPIENCPFYFSLEKILSKIKNKIENKTIEETIVKKYSKAGIKIDDVFQDYLIQEMPKKEDLVFCHGDYCLPNVLIKNNSLTGIIDWGYAGIADRYFDLAMSTWSLSYNYKENNEKLVELYLKEYGIDKLDQKKFYYYRTLIHYFNW